MQQTTTNGDVSDDDYHYEQPINQPEESVQQQSMQMDYTYDPWDDKKVYQFFLPNGGEHPKDAVARRIDLLLEARTSPDGYQMVVEGGDPYGNCSELDKIKILEKCLYLIVPYLATPERHGPPVAKKLAIPAAFFQLHIMNALSEIGGQYLK